MEQQRRIEQCSAEVMPDPHILLVRRELQLESLMQHTIVIVDDIEWRQWRWQGQWMAAHRDE